MEKTLLVGVKSMIDSIQARPFLKWAGGKYRIMALIKENLPAGKRLIEPFLGSGAVFMNTAYSHYTLSDINEDLINIFNLLKNDPTVFMEFCRNFFSKEFNTRQVFMQLRATFNTTMDKRLRAGLFLYLNRHSYNGLMRYNKSGGFNTSFGSYKKPYFPENEMLSFAEKAQKATFTCLNYTQAMEQATKGDVVYCDPPYYPLSITANFTTYHAKGFTSIDHENLVFMAKKLAKKGIPVLISNHNTEFIQKLYKDAALVCFDVQRFISCNTSMRVKVGELLAVFK